MEFTDNYNDFYSFLHVIMSSMQTPSSSSGRLPYPGGAINPNDLPAEQRISLMRLQGPVSVLLAYHQDPQAKTLEATRKRMEAKGVLAGVEECRAREVSDLTISHHALLGIDSGP